MATIVLTSTGLNRLPDKRIKRNVVKLIHVRCTEAAASSNYTPPYKIRNETPKGKFISTEQTHKLLENRLLALIIL